MEQSRNAYRVLVGRCEEKTSSGRPTHSWEDNIKIDLRDVYCDIVLVGRCEVKSF